MFIMISFYSSVFSTVFEQQLLSLFLNKEMKIYQAMQQQNDLGETLSGPSELVPITCV